jgi:hypothetical protein
MPKKETTRPERFNLGGEYYWPGAPSKPVHRARTAFLQLAVELEPQILSDIVGELLPLYLKHRESSPKWPPEELPQEVEDALSRWQEKWNLPEPWARHAAVRAPEMMWKLRRIRPPFRDWWGAMTLPEDKHIYQPPFTFDFESIVLEDESIAEYRARAQEAFRYALDEYLRQVQSRAKYAGMKPVPRKRVRSGKDRWVHLEWLVRERVQRWSRKQIARTYDVSTFAVQDGIEAARKLLVDEPDPEERNRLDHRARRQQQHLATFTAAWTADPDAFRSIARWADQAKEMGLTLTEEVAHELLNEDDLRTYRRACEILKRERAAHGGNPDLPFPWSDAEVEENDGG